MTYGDVSSGGHGLSTREGRPEGGTDGSDLRPGRRVQIILFALLAIALVWLITTRSLVAYLADVSPEAALGLRPGDAAALSNLAGQELKLRRAAAGTVKTDAEIHALAEAALLDDPLNARAFGILGQLAISARKPDKKRIAQLMGAAARRSLRETGAIFWLMQNSFEKQDFAKAIEYADIILNTNPQMARYVVPFLARIAENKTASPKLVNLLAGDPRWRRQFFYLLSKSISNESTSLDIFLKLKDSSTPPTTLELRSYLNFLIGKKFYEIAYYTWLQFLPPQQLAKAGFLFNGSFEMKPGGLPFDWDIKQGSGVTVAIAAHPDEDGRHALFIEFRHGRVQFRDVTQMIMLAPGTYRLEGRYKGQIIGRRGLVWRIQCVAGRRQVLGESPMFIGVARKWKPFDISFKVPDAGCRMQYIKLHLDARSASEQLVTGSAWYDDLKISRDRKVLEIKQTIQ